MAVIVKNTFVQLEHDDMAQVGARRCSSAPPAARRSYFSDGEDDAFSVCADFKYAGDEVSTHAASTGTPQGSHSVAGSSVTVTPITSPMLEYRMPLDVQGLNFLPLAPFTYGQEHCEPCSTPGPYQWLNVGAPPFQPHYLDHTYGSGSGASDVSTEAQRLGSEQDISYIITSIVSAMMVYAAASLTTRVIEHKAGSTIDIQLPEMYRHYKDDVIAFAQAALMDAAEKSAQVYVIGYMSEAPLRMSSRGFEATFGAMLDENRACWDEFAYGCCGRGSSCRWEHPVNKTTINVLVTNTP